MDTTKTVEASARARDAMRGAPARPAAQARLDAQAIYDHGYREGAECAQWFDPLVSLLIGAAFGALAGAFYREIWSWAVRHWGL